MCDGKACHDRDERPETAKRNHQAEQEKKVISSVQNVPEACLNKPPGRLIPSWVESHQARIIGKLERPLCTARRKKTQGSQHSDPQPFEPGANRECRAVGLD